MANSSVLSVSEQEQRIAERVNPEITKALAVSRSAGGVMFADAQQIMEFAKVMAVTGVGIRKHLRGNVGACLAISIQAVEWEMSPFAVANKSYFVNDQIAFESQLVQAVILKRAPIIGRIKFSFRDEGDNRICIASARLNDGSGEVVEYESPRFSKIQPKNSPLWKTDPDQQHCYYSGRALCRRHFPDVLLGVYAEDELQKSGQPAVDAPTFAKDVTPARSIASRLGALAGDDSASPQVDHEPETTVGDADGHDATDAGADVGDQPEDDGEQELTPREAVIVECRGRVADGTSALRVLNELAPEKLDLLTQEDRDELKAQSRQFQNSRGRRVEHADG